MSLSILGIGTAVPDHAIAQGDAAGLALAFANAPPGRERALAAIYRQSGIRTRGSVLLEAATGGFDAQTFFPAADSSETRPTTGDRMARYAIEAGRLAIMAAGDAVCASGVAADEFTHLVTCSCTGFANPGVDLEIIRHLGLPASVSRTHVGFMGCHGAFNALRVADAFVAADPHAVVLVTCVELCSLHLQYGSHGDHVVANSLFADGAAAVVGVGSGHGRVAEGGWQILRQASEVLPDSEQEMGWLIGDSGFEMTLSARVPELIEGHLRPVVEQMLERLGLSVGEVATWAVHPGGPRILTGVERAFDLPGETLAASRGVLAEHGNMSSATILFILDRLEKAGAAGPCVALAFGPGLTVEMAVLGRAADAENRPSPLPRSLPK
jgi:predicted naringenin-chalcone synthase